MSYIFINTLGQFFALAAGGTIRSQLTLPTNVYLYKPTGARPSIERYALLGGNYPYNLTYIEGIYNKMVVWTQNRGLFRGGIQAHTAAPTLATSGAGSLTGSVVASFTWAQYVGNLKVHEGNPSPKTAGVAFSSNKVSISGVPSTAPDPRTTHWRVYLSVDGSLSYLAGTYPLGATSAAFDVSNVTLTAVTNETLPIKTDADGNPVDDVLARGVPPYASVIRFWHRRLWYIVPNRAGVFFSALDEPESVDGDEDLSFIPMPGGEYPLGLGYLDDELAVFCKPDVVYSISGFTENDFQAQRIATGIRLIAPHGVITSQGMIFFPTDQGVMAYFGGGGNGFRNLMARSMRSYWITQYAANTAAYENGVGADDMVYGDYVFLPDLASPMTEWRGYYRPMVEDGEREPWWHLDTRARQDAALGTLYYSGTQRGALAHGECDGFVRLDDTTNADDDGDTTGKKQFRAMTKHFFMGDQSGDIAHGRTYTNLDIFGLQGGLDATLNLYAGDETANGGTAQAVTLTAETSVVGQTTEPSSRRIEVSEVSGKGLTVEFVVDNPLGVEFRGVGINWRKGPQTRP